MALFVTSPQNSTNVELCSLPSSCWGAGKEGIKSKMRCGTSEWLQWSGLLVVCVSLPIDQLILYIHFFVLLKVSGQWAYMRLSNRRRSTVCAHFRMFKLQTIAPDSVCPPARLLLQWPKSALLMQEMLTVLRAVNTAPSYLCPNPFLDCTALGKCLQ